MRMIQLTIVLRYFGTCSDFDLILKAIPIAGEG
ncbi:hypothetical protein EDF59_1132 [Novosphingobium sp. ST904]|nr:hypothetical protein EDF59_1132 [Novosphingobium sp. ST904]